MKTEVVKTIRGTKDCVIKDDPQGVVCGNPRFLTLTTDYVFSDDTRYVFEFDMCSGHTEAMRGRLKDIRMDQEKARRTPEFIGGPEELPEGSVFVFGSNTEGIHGTGSARTAIDRFGAVYGQAYGRQGDSYAICTTDLTSDERYPLHLIQEHVEEFLAYAEAHPDETFWVTKVGSLRAGYSINEMASMWRTRPIPTNVVLPEEYMAS